jgi:hypothetical protein
VDFCAANRLPSVKAAWRLFSTARRNARQAFRISYGQVCYSFTAASFYQMQAHLKAGALAQRKLEMVRCQAVADITNHLPARTPGRLTELKPASFEI